MKRYNQLLESAKLISRKTMMEGLFYAITRGNREITKFLLEKGVNPNFLFENGYTPLYYAVSGEDKKLVKLLLQYGANPNKKPKYEPVLTLASENGDKEIVELLLNSEANPNIKDRGNWTTLMHLAAVVDRREKNYEEKYLEIMGMLLSKGADPNIRNKNGWAAIHYAIRENMEKVVELLLQNGAEVELEIKEDGNTPLFYAIGKRNIKIVEILLKHGAKVNYAARFQSPLYSAEVYGSRKIIALLKQYGAKY